MARVKFNPCEVDANFQIEDAIVRTLKEHAIGEVSVSVIEKNYDLLDDKFNPIEGTFEDKCRVIAKRVSADVEIRGANVIFARERSGNH